MTRIPLLAGNWKMHCLRTEARALAEGVTRAIGDQRDRQVLFAPPFTSLETVAAAIGDSGIYLGGQNMHWEPKGAFTGEVSAAMLRDVGCSHVILGHSERRQLFGETDETVNRKLKAARAADLTPIVCVGETLAEREAGQTLELVGNQVRNALLGLDSPAIASLIIAYEPVWAIGTGKVATPEQAQEVHALIRSKLVEIGSQAAAGACRILYGGSVKPENIDVLMGQPDIDGALVGGASLDVDSFVRIVRFGL